MAKGRPERLAAKMGDDTEGQRVCSAPCAQTWRRGACGSRTRRAGERTTPAEAAAIPGVFASKQGCGRRVLRGAQETSRQHGRPTGGRPRQVGWIHALRSRKETNGRATHLLHRIQTLRRQRGRQRSASRHRTARSRSRLPTPVPVLPDDLIEHALIEHTPCTSISRASSSPSGVAAHAVSDSQNVAPRAACRHAPDNAARHVRPKPESARPAITRAEQSESRARPRKSRTHKSLNSTPPRPAHARSARYSRSAHKALMQRPQKHRARRARAGRPFPQRPPRPGAHGSAGKRAIGGCTAFCYRFRAGFGRRGAGWGACAICRQVRGRRVLRILQDIGSCAAVRDLACLGSMAGVGRIGARAGGAEHAEGSSAGWNALPGPTSASKGAGRR
jgi:hypothetical protein